MRPEAPSRLPLVCPACRAGTSERWDMYTLELARVTRSGEEIEEGVLRCTNCRRAYPIIDGIPVIIADWAGFLAGAGAVHVAEAPLAPEVAAIFAAPGPDDAPWARLLEHLSIYLDAHWGDRAEPPPDGPVDPGGFAALAARLRALAGRRVARAVELGAGVGRGLAALADGAGALVGIDVHLPALRRARRLLRGETVAFARRVGGRHYEPAAVHGEPIGAEVTLICADALDPPLPPASADRVVALNVLDALPDPGALLAVAAGLTAPGGELVLASPYAWQTGVVAEEHRLGADAAGEVRARLREQGIETLEEADVPWTLRRDARAGLVYRVHYLRGRKAT